MEQEPEPRTIARDQIESSATAADPLPRESYRKNFRPEQLLVARTPPPTSRYEHNRFSEQPDFEHHSMEYDAPSQTPTMRTDQSPFYQSASSPPTIKKTNPFAINSLTYRTSPRASSSGQGSRYSSPPNYSNYSERSEQTTVESHLVSVLVAFVPEVWKGSQNAALQNAKMDSMMCDLNMPFTDLQAVALSTMQKTDARVISVRIHLCRWLGTAVGKHELKMLHEADATNYYAVLCSLLSTHAGEFGLAIEPVMKKEPGFVRSLLNKMKSQSKKRKLDNGENAV
jgi:hypothetical protein